MRIEHSAGFIVFKNSSNNSGIREFLLLKNIGGHYDFPKGHLEAGESPKQAAERELLEETGISNIEIIPNFSQQIHYYFQHNQEKVHKFVIYFLARSIDEEIKISSEHLDFKWLNFEETIKALTFDNAKKLITQANNYLNQFEKNKN